nr:GNAT family N-acetyltransferase [uncultured Aminipila sp.]
MIKIMDIDYDEIKIIRDLWEKNRLYHQNISEHFKEVYGLISFDERMKDFSASNKNTIKITVAKNNDQYIGYCISTTVDGAGQLQSIHVCESNRGNGIGRQLASEHIEWMREMGCKEIGVNVSQENASAIAFYKDLGFYPNTLYMQKK